MGYGAPWAPMNDARKVAAPLGALFDFGGTLMESSRYDPDAEWGRVLELCDNPRNVSTDDVREAGLRAWDEIHAALGITRREDRTHVLEVQQIGIQRLALAACGLIPKVSAKEMEVAAWDAAYDHRPTSGIVELLEALASRGVAMGVVSNATVGAHCLEHDLQRGILDHHFDFVITSADYALRKPSVGLMSAAVSRLDLPPEQIWFAGDKAQFDVAGANAVGMTSIWYNASGDGAGPHVPDITVTSWAELTQMLP